MASPSAAVTGANFTVWGFILSLVLAAAGFAYKYGQKQKEADNRAEVIDRHANALEEVRGDVKDMNEQVGRVVKGLNTVGSAVEKNRRGVNRQARIIHNRLLDAEETCNQPDCPICTGSGGRVQSFGSRVWENEQTTHGNGLSFTSQNQRDQSDGDD